VAERLTQARCKHCGVRQFDHDGRGYVEWVCRSCGVFNVHRPMPLLPPLTKQGKLVPRK